MYTVLLAVDGTDGRATAQAEAVVNLPGTPAEMEVVVAHIFESNPEGASVTQISGARRAADILEEGGWNVTLAEESGKPAQALLQLAVERDVNLICISGRQRTPTGKALFGSTAQSILLETDRPVLHVPAE